MGEGPKKQQISAGLLAHVDAGKTTLSEAMLYESGARRTLGRVDHGDAYLDTHALERARGITIFSKQALLETASRELILVDTPGHVDFSAEAERTLQVLDCAVLVISGTDGVQAHTHTLWRLLERYDVPTFLFINKMDLPGMDREKLLEQLRIRFMIQFSVKTDIGALAAHTLAANKAQRDALFFAQTLCLGGQGGVLAAIGTGAQLQHMAVG